MIGQALALALRRPGLVSAAAGTAGSRSSTSYFSSLHSRGRYGLGGAANAGGTTLSKRVAHNLLSPLKWASCKDWVAKRIPLAERPLSPFTARASAARPSPWKTATRVAAGQRWAANATRGPPHPSEGFLRSSSTSYLEDMYEAWRKVCKARDYGTESLLAWVVVDALSAQDPTSVHASWNSYFNRVAQGAPPGAGGAAPSEQLVRDHLNVLHIVRAYQVRGHTLANLDPLGISDQNSPKAVPAPELMHQTYGFTDADLDRKFVLGTDQIKGVLSHDQPMTLREIIERLKKVYCGSIGYEYMHIQNRQECNWIRDNIENLGVAFNKEEQHVILDRLMWAELFEKFVASKWKTEKRFGLEGAESLIPGLKAFIDQASELGAKSIILGMPHRGRLNVLSNVVRKPHEAIFSEFSGSSSSDMFSGDVKYHLGMTFQRPTRTGKTIHLGLVANPSHLEAVNPVVMGKTGALQYQTSDKERKETMAILLHGDAAFAGQGVVYESIGMAYLPNYGIGGVFHVVVNNQIGFTTDARFGRSTQYCTDLALSFQSPVLHVNGDDTEAVVHAFNFAAEYRARFKKDVVVDLVCYRRHGHNEVDNPFFTQPKMYFAVQKQPTTLDLYKKLLLGRGTVTEAELKDMETVILGKLQAAFERAKSYQNTPEAWTTSEWMVQNTMKSLKAVASEILPPKPTGVQEDTLRQIGTALTKLPASFALHDNVAKTMKAKAQALTTGTNIDWATAEALAFGSLLMEHHHVRLSGQDVERGTFSHRHAVLHDQKLTHDPYVPLNHLAPAGQQAEFVVTNSHLSEYGVLGYEYGYSLVSPTNLVLWEAQFGDFANTAQVIIDQFIAAGEKKWLQSTGIVLLLPHGYDGAGPEHSSARMERFLQLCDDDPSHLPPRHDVNQRRQIQDANLQIVYATTPANYFHVLRRQIHRDFRKPLVVFVSKSLLRSTHAVSSYKDMAPGTHFLQAIPDDGTGLKGGRNGKCDVLGRAVAEKDVKRVIFCSGQVYYLLANARKLNNVEDVAICRVEQVSPFPYDIVSEELSRFPNAKIVWAQEEPRNAGAWTYVEPRLRSLVSQWHTGRPQAEVLYAGRAAAASTATGYKKQHVSEEAALTAQALYGEKRSVKELVDTVPRFA